MDIEVIHLIWKGPITVVEALKLNKKGDRGLYQVYGTHSITGPRTLLYVGQTNGGTFSTRMLKHREEWLKWEPDDVRIHVGRIGSDAQPSKAELKRSILRAEMITI